MNYYRLHASGRYWLKITVEEALKCQAKRWAIKRLYRTIPQIPYEEVV
jgi:hypothetical protein